MPKRAMLGTIAAAGGVSAACGLALWSSVNHKCVEAPIVAEDEAGAPLLPSDSTPSGMITLRPDEVAREAAAPGAPNLVLIIGCTVRRDQVSVYGAPPEVTPFLSSLARRGAVLDDVVAAAPWTKMASAAILTGLHPVSFGMAEPSSQRNHRVVPAEVSLLAERMQAGGYSTVGFTANPNLNAAFGFSQGFDAYRQLEKLWSERSLKLAGESELAGIVSLVKEVKETSPKRPIFLQAVLVDAHGPHGKVEGPTNGLPDEVVAYRGALNGLDHTVAALESELESLGLNASNTIFAFVSDHGEGLLYPAHHGRSHGRQLYPSSVGAVAVMAGPGIGAGVRVSGVASQVDLMPTLLGLVGLPQGEAGHGEDLSAHLADGSPLPERVAYSDTWFLSEDKVAQYDAERACIRDVAKDVTTHCYLRKIDPDCVHGKLNLEVEGELESWRASMIGEQQTRGVAGEHTPNETEADQLEALGYLQSD